MFSPHTSASALESISPSSTSPGFRRRGLLQKLQAIMDDSSLPDYRSGSLKPIISILDLRRIAIKLAILQIPNDFNPELRDILLERVKIYEFIIHELQEYQANREKLFSNSSSELEAESKQLMNRQKQLHENLVARIHDLTLKRTEQSHEEQKLDQDFEKQNLDLQQRYQTLISDAENELLTLQETCENDVAVLGKNIKNLSQKSIPLVRQAIKDRIAQFEKDRNGLQQYIAELRSELRLEEQELNMVWSSAEQYSMSIFEIEIENLKTEIADLHTKLYQLRSRLDTIKKSLSQIHAKKKQYDSEKMAPDINDFLTSQTQKLQANSENLKPLLLPLAPAASNNQFTPPRARAVGVFETPEGQVILAPATPGQSTPRRVFPRTPYPVATTPVVSTVVQKNKRPRGFSEEAENNISYRIIPILGDGNCGYTGVGIERKDACAILYRNLVDQAVLDFLEPAIQETLRVDPHFENYLADQEVDSENPVEVAQAFLLYDIHERNNWVHPGMLQALAYIENFGLRIWCHERQADGRSRLVPHRTNEYDYAVFMPENPTRVIDLLFVNNNHFNGLEISPEYLAEFYPEGEQGRLKLRNLGQELEEIAAENAASSDNFPPTQSPGSPSSPRLGLFTDPDVHLDNIIQQYIEIADAVMERIALVLESTIFIDKASLITFAKEKIKALDNLLANDIFQNPDQYKNARSQIEILRDLLTKEIVGAADITEATLNAFVEKIIRASISPGK